MTTTAQQFTFYSHDGKVFAENADGTFIELGLLRRDERGKYYYRVPGTQFAGYGFDSGSDALAGLTRKLTLEDMNHFFANAIPSRVNPVRLRKEPGLATQLC